MISYKNKFRMIFSTYWPLALSWVFMSVDNPSINAVIGRMSDPEHCLAAHGGVVFPLALIIEAPVINIISTSIALCKDKQNYERVKKMMMVMGIVLTCCHLMLSIPFVFNLVIIKLMHTPSVLLPYVKQGLILIVPWTWSIAYRRFYQGVLIRFGYSRQVTIGTFIRMMTMFITLGIGYAIRDHITGAALGATALSCGVFAEGMYAGFQGRKAARKHYPAIEPTGLISWSELAAFVVPLTLTNLISLGYISIGSAAIARMVNPLVSLAVWPVMTGLMNILRSITNALNETSLSFMIRSGYFKAMKRFMWIVAGVSEMLFLLFILTPINEIWFVKLSALAPELANLGEKALWFAFLIPFVNGPLNFYQAVLLASKRTRGILESLILFLSVLLLVFGIGILNGQFEGVIITMTGMNLAWVCQTLWTWSRARKFEKNFI